MRGRRLQKDARKIIEDFQPDIAIGTGGYVCYPVLKAAAQLGIPTIVHESNAVPGLTTKMLAGAVDRILVGFEGEQTHTASRKRSSSPARRCAARSRPAPRRRPSASSDSTGQAAGRVGLGARSAHRT